MHCQCSSEEENYSPYDSWHMRELSFRKQFRREVEDYLSVEDRAELVVQCYISARRKISRRLGSKGGQHLFDSPHL